jgi:hypothetical protein
MLERRPPSGHEVMVLSAGDKEHPVLLVRLKGRPFDDPEARPHQPGQKASSPERFIDVPARAGAPSPSMRQERDGCSSRC